MSAQNQESQLPYQEIPETPENYSPGNVVSRMIDGLGYRYYWATEGLTLADLNYKPSPDARTLHETITHILGLSETIKNAATNTPNLRPIDYTTYSYTEKRKMTLNLLKKASDLYRNKSAAELEAMKIIFQRGEQSFDYPFWNMLNGPIADAVYHTGQLVTLRRSSGNPMHSGVNVFTGKTGK